MILHNRHDNFLINTYTRLAENQENPLIEGKTLNEGKIHETS